jgi:hypothetical protein
MPLSCSVIGRVTTTKIGFDVDLSGGDGGEMFKAGLKGIVLKKLNAPYLSGPSKT